jgi:hypothetical protein
MTDNDRDNLNFLLTVTPEGFEAWLNQADDDDVNYALELLKMRKSEILVKLMDASDKVEDTSEANQALKKFML